MSNERVTDPAEIEAYLASVRGLYDLEQTAIHIAKPYVVERTPSGARVMAWLPDEAARPVELDHAVNAIELSDPRVVEDTPSGPRVMAWLPVEDEDLWK